MLLIQLKLLRVDTLVLRLSTRFHFKHRHLLQARFQNVGSRTLSVDGDTVKSQRESQMKSMCVLIEEVAFQNSMGLVEPIRHNYNATQGWNVQVLFIS